LSDVLLIQGETQYDPEELTNLAINATADNTQLMSRLNTLLLILNSCESKACQNPWQYLKPEPSANRSSSTEPAIASPRRALDPQYDDYFAGFGTVRFDDCLVVQRIDNEQPFYPSNASQGLGSQWRQVGDFYNDSTYNVTGNEIQRSPGAGTAAQRNATYADLMADAANLTDAQIGANN
jgi:N-acetylglucosamine-6-sulfatase